MNDVQDPVAFLKSRVSLSSIVTRYVTLQKKGQRLAACCPFHSEKTPSFYVDDRKGLFHCFGCGKGGDLIGFVQEIEHLEFYEALEFLAEIAGVELPRRRRSGPSRDKIERLRAVFDAAAGFYADQLAWQTEATQYLVDRGIQPNTWRLFKLGYASKAWDQLYHHLAKDHDPILLQQTGLFRSGKSGAPYDLFRHRIIFPIHDLHGHVIAFGGRRLGDEGPKYINSPESALFKKGRQVYNLNFAKAIAKRTKRIIVVEGYLDVLQLTQAGFGETVAPMGTALTPNQAHLLARFADTVLLNFDGDEAGFRAARKSTETLLKENFDLRVICLPQGSDPDDYVRAHGAEGFQILADQAVDFFDFLLQFYATAGDVHGDPRLKSTALREICHTLSHIDDVVVRDHFYSRLADALNVSVSIVHTVAKETAPTAPKPAMPQATQPQKIQKPQLNKVEAEFLYLFMHHSDLFSVLDDTLANSLPQILSQIFSNRPWILEFLSQEPGGDLQDQLKDLPLPYQERFREVFFSREFSDAPERLHVLLPEIVKQMLTNQVELNNRELSQTPASEVDRKRALMKHNMELMAQIYKL